MELASVSSSGDSITEETPRPSFYADMVALNFACVRGMPFADLKQRVHALLTDARPHQITALFVLAFQCRYCRGGKGERQLFHHFMLVLYHLYPDIVLALIPVVPYYGSWKDLLRMVEVFDAEGVDTAAVSAAVVHAFSQQLLIDYTALQDRCDDTGKRASGISLAAKHAPSLRQHFDKKFKLGIAIALAIFPNEIEHERKYRRLLSALRAALRLPETFMSTGRWAQLDFSRAASVCFLRNTRAFLNENRPTPRDTADRIDCRQNLLRVLESRDCLRISGKMLFPHQLVEEVLKTRSEKMSSAVRQIMNAQWQAITKDVLEQIEQRKLVISAGPSGSAVVEQVEALEAAAAQNPDVLPLRIAADVVTENAIAAGASRATGKKSFIPMSDVSGSMRGVPMHVSIALGLLLSELNEGPFQHLVLTFAEQPTWHRVDPGMDFVDRVRALADADWGSSTNFYAAMQLIANIIVQERVDETMLPDLLVISDMEFNESLSLSSWSFYENLEPTGDVDMQEASQKNTAWGLKYEEISELFNCVGMELYGHKIAPPHITFWNARSEPQNQPATAETQGVTLLSGYSPSLLKFVLSGESVMETVVSGDGSAAKLESAKATPVDTLKKMLESPEYDSVRNIVQSGLGADVH